MKEYSYLLDLFSEQLNRHLVAVSNKSPRELYAPEEYILSLGGKRVRPLLALIACDLFDKNPEIALDSALAVELFHNFSLIHDDILDAAPLRRNQATVHVKWNNNIAVLSGDVMMVKAFQCLESYPPELFKKVHTLFSRTAIEVCEGQQLDMNFENQSDVSVESYLHMISLKTAVLLGCSLQLGAICAQSSETDQEHVYEFGKHLGISFQLLDDALDAFAPNAEKFGKQIGGDILANKKTFLLLKSIELASPAQKAHIHDLLKMAAGEEKVTRMLQIYRDLAIQTHCEAEADKHTRLAIQSLEKVNAPGTKKETLRKFALALLNRQI